MRVDVQLQRENCDKCGGVFAMATHFIRYKAEEGGVWYCPYCGNKWHYDETEVMTLQRRLKNAKDNLAAERGRHDQTRASLVAQKGVTTRMKNRIKNGVCPCCHRHFANLNRHMETKHPNFDKAEQKG